MKRTKLIYIMQEFSPDVGGWGMHLFSELSKFVDVTVLARPYGHSIKEASNTEIINPHFRIIRYEGKEMRGIIYPTNLRYLLELEKTKSCIVQMDEFFKFYTIQAAKWCKENNIPYIINSRMRPRPGIIRNTALWIFKELAEEAVLDAKKIIATQGEVSKEEFLNWFPLKQDSDFEIIPSGIDIKKFIKNHKSKIDKKVILAVSRIYPIKRIDLLLKVFSEVLKFRDDVELWIVGKGEEKSSKEMIKLEKVMRRLGLVKGDKVKFFGGLENKDLPEIYSQATVFVNTSETEGICFSFLEAMAFKIPILAWDIGGNSIVVENEVTGYLYEFGDLERMSIGILKLVSKRHADLRKKMGVMALNKLKKEFDIKKNVQKLLQVYREALE